jgi:hypothetical protein
MVQNQRAKLKPVSLPESKRVSTGRVVFYLLPSEVRQLRAYAKRQGKSASYVVAEAVRSLLTGRKGGAS